MRIDELGDVAALAFVAGVMVVAWIVYRLIPSPTGPEERISETFVEADIVAYDPALPKYILAGLGALVLGGVHAAIKSFPPIYLWLSGAGHGGHMVRDLANTHLVIVVGGTVIATGLTWYALPRIARRPLFSTRLATLSLWCTVIGALGFYLANTILGVIFGIMAYDGIGYEAAKPMLGAARTVPIALSSTIMGIGYWTFVLNVALTIIASKRVREPKPLGHLLKFFAVGALGLFIGTVQGVIQVLPDNERWLHAAAPAGQYIDPIAHAHVNLVTGTLSLIAGLAFAWGAWGRDGEHGRRLDAGRRRIEQLVFWTLVPGSLLFYLTFMGLGFVEGHLVADRGLSFDQAVALLGPFHVVPLAIAGTLTLAGSWLLLGTLLRRFWHGPNADVAGTPLVVVGALALFVGTAQGLLQLVPGVKAWIVSAGAFGDAVANAHAQLNMLGGVMLALLGLVLARPALLPGVSAAPLARRIAVAGGAGVGLYWLAALANAVTVGEGIRSGLPEEVAVRAAGPIGAIGMSLGAIVYTLAFGSLAIRAWPLARGMAATSLTHLRQRLRAVDGPPAAWRRHRPIGYFLATEVVSAAVGFPGLGWIMAGRPTIGVPLALVNPGIAWALIPMLSSPYADGPLRGFGTGGAVGLYLLLVTVISTVALSVHLRLARRNPRPTPAAQLHAE